MATAFVEVTPEEADKLWEAGLLWSKFLRNPWRHESRPKNPYMEGGTGWTYIEPSSWGTNWKFAIQVEE